MSAAGRFAPITAELLARKGEARPLNLLSPNATAIDRRDVVRELDASTLPSRTQVPFEVHARGTAAPHHPADVFEANASHVATAPRPAEVFEAGNFFGEKPSPGRRHSISLAVSENEFERLGLVAVKKRVNKQQLLRLAIDHYLEKLAAEYRSDCRCISATGGACCGGKPG